MFAALIVFSMIGSLGHIKYEECYEQMSKTLSGGNDTGNGSLHFALEPPDKKYDIYFWTAAENWTDVNSTVPVRVRYGYGEIGKEDKEEYFSNFKKYSDDSFTDITDPFVFNTTVMNTTCLGKALRDCFIGYEATASGAGAGFVFIAFTKAVKLMPASYFWSVLFFLMLITLGIDSGCGIVEAIIAAIEDLTHMKRIHATIISCGACFLLAICLFPFGWGIYVLNLIDAWTANWTFLVITLFECISVAWIYGLATISYDVRLMTGKKPSIYYLICWKYVSPIIIIVLLASSIIKFIYGAVKTGGLKYSAFNPDHPKHEDGTVKLDIPAHILAIGFFLLIFCIMWVPLHFFLRKTKGNMIKDQAFGDFPEEELREERNIDVVKEEDQFTQAEKTIMGGQSLQSLQEHRDTKVGKKTSFTGGLSTTSKVSK